MSTNPKRSKCNGYDIVMYHFKDQTVQRNPRSVRLKLSPSVSFSYLPISIFSAFPAPSSIRAAAVCTEQGIMENICSFTLYQGK